MQIRLTSGVLAMDFIQVVLVVGVFFFGLVLLILGFTRNEGTPPTNLMLPDFPVQVKPVDPAGTGIPSEHHHPARLRIIGAGLVVLSVVLGFILV